MYMFIAAKKLISKMKLSIEMHGSCCRHVEHLIVIWFECIHMELCLASYLFSGFDIFLGIENTKILQQQQHTLGMLRTWISQILRHEQTLLKSFVPPFTFFVVYKMKGQIFVVLVFEICASCYMCVSVCKFCPETQMFFLP